MFKKYKSTKYIFDMKMTTYFEIKSPILSVNTSKQRHTIHMGKIVSFTSY